MLRLYRGSQSSGTENGVEEAAKHVRIVTIQCLKRAHLQIQTTTSVHDMPRLLRLSARNETDIRLSRNSNHIGVTFLVRLKWLEKANLLVTQE